ncbi:MAG: hypothetical protein MR958_05795 [Spirochaetia bacterium]|nr:hypothetical protein [Spirochaetia bacterium]MDD7269557.1 hypothetical protein [Treponema sp.]MDD7269634.1 hypothetical protein [Treponema sp.]
MKRLFKAMVSLFCGLTLIAGVTACKTDVNSGDQVVEIGLFLTQTPVTPVNGDVTVDVTVVPKNVQSLKWLEGEKSVKDFDSAGTELTVTDGKASFTVSKSGNYTVYAKVNSKSEAVKTIFVEDVVYDLKDLITLSQSPAIPMNGDVVVEVTLNRQDVQLVKYAKGELEAEAFENGGTEVVKDENGKYTFTVSEKDWYTVYAKVNSKSFAVKKIDVEDVAFDVSGLISLSQSPASNVPTNAEVTVTALLSRSDAQTVKWAAGTHTVEDFATIRSTELTADEDGKYSFNVTENGTYTVYAQCNSKSKAVNVINVTNIDKVAPAAVTNLAANYVYSSKRVNVSWVNPLVVDLNHLEITVKQGDTVIVDKTSVTGTSIAVNNVEYNSEKEISVSIEAVDNAGNHSAKAKYSFVPNASATIEKITLSKYHVSACAEQKDRLIDVTVFIQNADLIGENEDVKVQVVGDTTANYVAVLDRTTGQATCQIVGANTDTSENGKNYTVRAKIGTNSADTTHTARFNVSYMASLYSPSYYVKLADGSNSSFSTEILKKRISDITSESYFTVQMQGKNFDVSDVRVKVEGTDIDVPVNTDKVKWTATTGNHNANTFTVEVPYPAVEDMYKVIIVIDGIKVYTKDLQVYGDSVFTSFSIPDCGVYAEGNVLKSVLTGNNFDTPTFDTGDIDITCPEMTEVANGATVKVISNTELEVDLVIPGVAGVYNVNLQYGEKKISTLVKVYGKNYNTGDLLLMDGTVIPYNPAGNSYTDEQKAKAIAVYAGYSETGIPTSWLGLKRSELFYWLDPYIKYEEQRSLNFEELEATLVNDKYVIGSYDGSLSWDVISKTDTYSQDLEKDYPAFKYANNYGTTYNIEGTYKDGWYIPTIGECSLWAENALLLNEVIVAAGGDSFTIDGKNNNYCNYWTSSVNPENKKIWQVQFYSNKYNEIYCDTRISRTYVRVMHKVENGQ